MSAVRPGFDGRLTLSQCPVHPDKDFAQTSRRVQHCRHQSQPASNENQLTSTARALVEYQVDGASLSPFIRHGNIYCKFTLRY